MRHLIPLPLLLLLLALLIFLFHPTSSSAMQRPGGTTTHTRPVTTEVTALCNGVRVQAEERIRALGGETETWEAEGYRSQVVAGTNYFVKVLTAPNNPKHSHALLRIFKGFGSAGPELAGVKLIPGDEDVGYFGPGDSVSQGVAELPRMAGGISPSLHPPTPHVTQIVDALRQDIEARANGGESYESWEVLGYKSQVVAGMNYFVKIRVSTASPACIHVRIYEPLPHTGQPPEVSSVQTGKEIEHDVAYF